MKKLIFLLLLLALASCRTTGKLVPIPMQTKTTVRDRLAPVVVPSDSSTLLALFECNNLNQVQLKEIRELKSKGVESKLDFNKTTAALSYKVKVIHDTIYVPVKDSLVYQDKPYPVEVEKIVYEQTAVQKFLSIFGGIALLLLVIGVVIKFIK